jgi:replicative DNA helicase
MPNKEEARHIQSILSDYMDVVEQVDTNPDANKVFVPTGLVDLDRLLGGLARGDMDIIAARPSLGKTSLLLKIASHIAADTGPVLLFSLEMSAEQLAQRLLSMETALPVNQLRMYRFGSNDMNILISGVGRVSMGELYIDDTPGLTITEMRARARRLQFRLNQPLAMIGMDYIGLASYSDAPGRNPSEPEGLTHISKYAKQLAREMDCPFLVLSQLNREVEKQHEKRPMLSNLRMSGSLEQDADVAMFLYNYNYYFTPKEQREDVEKAEIMVLKHRNGDTGTVEVGWVRKRAQFIDWQW